MQPAGKGGKPHSAEVPSPEVPVFPHDNDQRRPGTADGSGILTAE